jgi:hypothetical protein
MSCINADADELELRHTASWLPALRSRATINNGLVSMEDAHHAIVANTDQPGAIWAPGHLRCGEVTLR